MVGLFYAAEDGRVFVTAHVDNAGRPFVRETRVVMAHREPLRQKEYRPSSGYGETGNDRWLSAVFALLVDMEAMQVERRAEEDGEHFQEDEWVLAYKDRAAQLEWLCVGY